MTEPTVIVPIVEGDGEVRALPVLLRNLCRSIDSDRPMDIRRGMRVNRGTLLKAGELERYVDLAARTHGPTGATIVLVDADDDCAGELGPQLQARAGQARADAHVAVVLAVREYEGWFIAGASSIAGQRGLPDDLSRPPDPEAIRDAKGWLQDRRTDGLAYSPTVDQPALSALLDLNLARSNSPSFDKLWREVERLLRLTAPSSIAQER